MAEIAPAIEEMMGVIEQLGQGMDSLHQQVEASKQESGQLKQMYAELSARFEQMEKAVSSPAGFEEPMIAGAGAPYAL